MADELATLDAIAQAELVRRGDVKPIELIDRAIARIEKINPQLNAVITPLFGKARARANSPTLPSGPFRGVPFLLKDLGCHSAGDPYHEGCRFVKNVGWVEKEDTYMAAKLRAARFIFLGKTNTPEFGTLRTTEPVAYLVASSVAAVVEGWSKRVGRSVTADDLELHNWTIAEIRRTKTAAQYVEAVTWLQADTRRIVAWWNEGCDLLLTPTIAEPPPLLGQFVSTPSDPLAAARRTETIIPFTPALNQTGQPAISLPLYRSKDGLPIGIHLVAAYGREDLLIRVAARLEQAKPWANKRPAVHA